MDTADIALLISVASASIAAFSLGWNVYRDIGLRPRVGVNLTVANLVPGLPGYKEEIVIVKCVNKGPGPVKLEVLNFAHRVLSEGGKTSLRHAITMCDHSQPYGAPLPKRLEVGETANYIIPFSKECFLELDVIRFAIADSLGRDHWVPERHIRKARERYVEKFVHSSVESVAP